ncbi:Superfamily I DNA and RNA helicase and helicase subunit, partial [human gut metagenome]
DLLARQFGVAPVSLALGVASWSEAVPTTDADDPGLAEQAEPLDVAEPAESAGDQGEQAQAAAAGLTRTINAPVLLRPVRLAS